MVRKRRVVLFVIGATVGNLLLMVLCFAGLMGLYSLTLGRWLPQQALLWALAVVFIASLAISTFVYRSLLKLLRERYHLDEYLGILQKH